jgi:small subunit ribosomal protein S13
MNFKRYGIGLSIENNFKKRYGINERTKTSLLKNKFQNIFKRKYTNLLIERKLFDNINENINFYKGIKNYRGTRHKNNYPVRGQRTHTNARKKIFKSKKFL